MNSQRPGPTVCDVCLRKILDADLGKQGSEERVKGKQRELSEGVQGSDEARSGGTHKYWNIAIPSK
jgi:hypothetical protein